MKLTCDICGGELEIKAGGQGASCKTCGLSYSVARLQEKLGVQSPAAPADGDVIYDAVDYEVVYDAVDYEVLDEPRCASESARAALYAVLVQTYGEKAIFPDALIGRDPANKADFLVRVEGYWPAVFFIVSSPDNAQAYQQAMNAGKLWETRNAFWFIVFERDCTDPEHIKQWVYSAMEHAVRT